MGGWEAAEGMVDEYRERMRDMKVQLDAMGEAKCANADCSDGKLGGGESSLARQGKMLLRRIAKMLMAMEIGVDAKCEAMCSQGKCRLRSAVQRYLTVLTINNQ
jgi:hypothetical protein